MHSLSYCNHPWQIYHFVANAHPSFPVELSASPCGDCLLAPLPPTSRPCKLGSFDPCYQHRTRLETWLPVGLWSGYFLGISGSHPAHKLQTQPMDSPCEEHERKRSRQCQKPVCRLQNWRRRAGWDRGKRTASMFILGTDRCPWPCHGCLWRLSSHQAGAKLHAPFPNK